MSQQDYLLKKRYILQFDGDGGGEMRGFRGGDESRNIIFYVLLLVGKV